MLDDDLVDEAACRLAGIGVDQRRAQAAAVAVHGSQRYATSVTWWALAAGAAAREALNGCRPAAGVALGLIAAPGWIALLAAVALLEPGWTWRRTADVAAGGPPVTLIVRIIAAALCPGTVHQACCVMTGTP